MIAIVIASHGDFAKGLLQSATMIFGKQTDVATVTFEDHETSDDLMIKFQTALSKFESVDGVLFLVDLWGGSPFTIAEHIVSQQPGQMALITGVNLPIVMDAFTIRDQPLDKVVAHLEKSGQKGIRRFEPEAHHEGA
ncbi:PTS sugar transporter subunit IIA [Lactobacillus sp. LC28-10]|uniref:PTS sugar transporter subunit IIA n=1 Tax=Secundilactobacillus angelensis TaxID=2722706 RepID=A0ABX1L0H0_9LACO|nr:PTS sugar transporter subunit IIA [Secundilactobacillus angelensis]MCH5462257.1 PTS sugar transporter subunit IIA [Secundilactobacillus angelensis]NLR18548.1 PTS sugar transporter subunit IIA [Secundilactobacillus angelensis]